MGSAAAYAIALMVSNNSTLTHLSLRGKLTSPMIDHHGFTLVLTLVCAHKGLTPSVQ